MDLTRYDGHMPAPWAFIIFPKGLLGMIGPEPSWEPGKAADPTINLMKDAPLLPARVRELEDAIGVVIFALNKGDAPDMILARNSPIRIRLAELSPWKAIAPIQVATAEAVATGPKTVREWLETLPDPYCRQALANSESETESLDSLDEAVCGAFNWDETPEGYDYWRDVSRHIEQPESIPLPDPSTAKNYTADAGKEGA